MNIAGQALMRLAAPGGRRGLSILVWHRVLPEADPLLPTLPDPDRFEHQLTALRACCRVLPLEEAVARLREGTLPPRAASITFDDGYRDNAEIALPLLTKHRLHATFFIASGFLDGGIMWNDVVIECVRQARGAALDASAFDLGTLPLTGIEQRRAALALLLERLKYLPLRERDEAAGRLATQTGARLPANLMLASSQVRELHRAGMGIGAHTVDHPILARLPLEEARRQIAWGRVQLEALAGPVRLFAYPNGKPGSDYGPEHVALVRELGFDAAVTTAHGAARDDLFQLPRFTPWDRTPLRFAARLARNLRTPARLA
ncbi:MAG TPA: polysaccharide deacetylase family protein [Telluria sp.]|nr:polysaccharide deacetylase family protein [Telluria sp.]